MASRATYGAPRIHAELRAQGEACCRNTVARLMHNAAIVPKTVRRFKVTTDSRHTRASPNLLGRVFTAARPDDCWLTDITFIPTRAGWLYLAVMIDLYSRIITGWTLKTELVMHCDYQTREQARVSLFEYMEVFYNRQRRHSSLHYATPLDFEAVNQVSTIRG